MALKLDLSLKKNQKMSLSPELHHMIYLLQLSYFEFIQEMDKAYEHCIFFEKQDSSTFDKTRINCKNSNSFSCKQPETLISYLHHQIPFLSLTAKEYAIAKLIIHSLDHKGYLSEKLTYIQAMLSSVYRVSYNDVERVLKKIQTLDPAGIAARDTQECLLLQMEGLEISEKLKKNSHLVLKCLRGKIKFPHMCDLKLETGLSASSIYDVLSVLKCLNLSPGFLPSGVDFYPNYITPDIIVIRKNDDWSIKTNKEFTPNFSINEMYVKCVNKHLHGLDDQHFWKNQLRYAQNFMKGIKYRYDTLSKIGIVLIEQQKQFLMYGEKYMKPLTMVEISNKVGVHPSTVSRIVKNKYIQTPRGIYPLHYFFSSKVSDKKISSIVLKMLINKLILSEPVDNPLCDSRLKSKLEDMGIHVARRTIAKYRALLGHPSCVYRKNTASFNNI